jgi:hypothetical protein
MHGNKISAQKTHEQKELSGPRCKWGIERRNLRTDTEHECNGASVS